MQLVKTVASCRYNHPELGVVHVKVHGNTNHVKARWVGQEVVITIPPKYPAKDFDRFLENAQAQLIQMRPAPTLYIGKIIDGGEVDFEFKFGITNNNYDSSVFLNTKNPVRGKKINYAIHIKESVMQQLAPDSAYLQEVYNKCLLWCAKDATSRFIIPHAKELADGIARRPICWQVKESKHKLGCCSSNGIITLSPRLIFLPNELRDFVIYHELAHLSEMNHSAAFHQLCNHYLHGREAELNSKLKAFKFPVF